MLFLVIKRIGESHHFNTYGWKLGKHKYMSEEELHDVECEVIFDMKIDQRYAFKVLF